MVSVCVLHWRKKNSQHNANFNIPFFLQILQYLSNLAVCFNNFTLKVTHVVNGFSLVKR
jgi:hypothetical protein